MEEEMEIISANIILMWNKWQLRVLVLMSLSWQILLVIFGSQRKYRHSSFISFLVWVMYLSADGLATLSLGTLVSNEGRCRCPGVDENRLLKALWAPFLLLHLGGPDTITAYSLADNNLWLRHLLGLLVQVTAAIFIFVRSWTDQPVTFVAIPLFFSGIVKYSERSWVLRSASTEQFEDSLLSSSAPTLQMASALEHNNNDLELERLHKAYSLFSLLKRLYANLSLRFVDGERSYSLTVKDAQSSEYAFKLVELQLGFLYDVLYTKATTMYSVRGLILRSLAFVSTLSALIVFIRHIDRPSGSKIDYYVTLALFIGAFFLDVWAVIALLFSDWTTRWITKKRTLLRNIMYSVISCCGPVSPCKKKWSESMSQHNLLTFFLKKRVTCCVQRDLFFRFYFKLKLYRQRRSVPVDAVMKRLIFEHLLQKHKRYRHSGFDKEELKNLLAYRGDSVLIEHHYLEDITNRTVKDVAFDHSLLIWHVATDICYHSDPQKHQDLNCEASKKISDYMLYLLVMHPFMLPKWIDRFAYIRDTYREAESILRRKQSKVKGKENIADACRTMLRVHAQCRVLDENGRKNSQSVLAESCRLAEQLGHAKDRWAVICQVWIEMLIYAASQCEWQAHAQQLHEGGELLTHVCLLMADLGLSEQFHADW